MIGATSTAQLVENVGAIGVWRRLFASENSVDVVGDDGTQPLLRGAALVAAIDDVLADTPSNYLVEVPPEIEWSKFN